MSIDMSSEKPKDRHGSSDGMMLYDVIGYMRSKWGKKYGLQISR